MATRFHLRHGLVMLQRIRPFHRCWKPMMWIWGAIFLSIFINVGSSWLTTKNFDLGGTPLGWLVSHPWITLLPLLLLVLLTLLAGLASLLANDALPISSLTLTPKQRMQFIQGFQQEYTCRLTSSLQEKVTLELHLQERTDVIASSADLVFHQLKIEEIFPPLGTSIIQVYDQASRGLLLLGAPGSGKTTLLLQLAQELLQRAENDPAQPLAIILNLSSWARTQLPLVQWLSEQCALIYGIPKLLCANWIAQEQVQFLLDGLDEMEASARTACIEVINTYRQAHLVPLVVCSRSREYESQPAHLILPRSVEIQPLTSAQTSNVVKKAGKSLAVLRAALRSNAILGELLTTPLMLSIAILTYRDKTPKELPQRGSPEEQQREIFEQYVQRMLKRYQQSRTFSLEQMYCSLIWLAQQMQQRHLTDFHLESLQIDWLENKRALNIYLLTGEQAIGLAVGSIGGLLMGFIIALIGRLALGFAAGALIGGPFVGLMFGLVFGSLGWYFGRAENIQLTEKFTWSWRKGSIALGAALAGGLISWLLLLALESLPGLGKLFVKALGGPVEQTTFILTYIVVLGFFVMLLTGLSGLPVKADLRLKPNQGIRTTGWNALWLGVTLLLGFGLISGLIFSLIFGPSTGLVSAMIIGLFFGLISALRFGGLAYFQHYLLRLLLARNHILPWHITRLFEEATACVLLQRLGNGYCFMHPLLQEYFASLPPSFTT